jgi:head-tail adaptor
MTAGQLKHRMHFQARSLVSDGWGGPELPTGPYETQFTAAAGLTAIRGGETTMAARLTGRQPYVVRVRQSADTKRVRHDWRIVDARTGAVYEVRSPVHDPDQKRAYLEFVVEENQPGVVGD